jgi:hypothetical protein
MPTASAISSTHSMLISVESMSKAISLKSAAARRAPSARGPSVLQLALDAQLVVAGQLDVLVLLHQLDDGHRLDRRVRLEGDVDHAVGAASTFTTP